MARIAAGTFRDAKLIGLVSFGHTMSHFYFLALPPILLQLRGEFHASYAALGVLMTGFAVAGGLAQTPIGFLVDRIGGRPVLIAGLLIESLTVGAIGFTDSLWQILVLYSIAGAGNAVFHPSDYAILTASVSRNRLGRAYSIHLLSGNLGFALAPPVMIALTAQWSWRTAFLVVGAVGALYALYLCSQGSLLRGDVVRRKARQEKMAAQSAKAGSATSGARLLLSIPLLMCLLFYIMMTFGFTGIRSFSVVALHLLHGTPEVVANSALFGFLLFSSFGILAGGVLADRIGPQIGTAVITLAIAGALVILVGAVPLAVAPLIAAMSASGFLQGLLMPTRDLLIRSITPDGSMGKVMGFLTTGMMASAAVVPVLYGWLIDAGMTRWVFWLSGVFVIGALLTFVTARTRAAPHPAA